MTRKLVPFSLASVVVVVAASFLGLVGCSSGERPSPSEPSAPVEEEPAIDVDAAAVLAMADRADGTADHVVSKCAACALAMEGDAQYAVEFEGYEVHLCSEGCKEHFEEAPRKVIATLAELREATEEPMQ